MKKNNFISFWQIYLKLIEEVAFNHLEFNKIYIYSFNVRPLLYEVTKRNNYILETTLKQHTKVENRLVDVNIHSKIETMKNLKIQILIDNSNSWMWHYIDKIKNEILRYNSYCKIN